MSQKANPTVIGLFVLIGIGLALGGTLILTSGQWLKSQYLCMMVFKEDVSGLNPGAPVQYQGVTVGTVDSIQLVVDREHQDAFVQVVVNFDPSRFTYIGDVSPMDEIQREVEEGMRAQLQSQSVVTGMQKIMLVMRPDTPLALRDPDGELPEIPTIPNLSQALAQELEGLPFREIVQHVHGTLANLDRLTNTLVEDNIMSVTQDTMESLRTLADSLEPLSREMGKELPGLLEGVDSNSKAFLELQTALNDTLEELRNSLDRDSTERYQFREVMSNLSEAAVRAGLLFEYLERHPESILKGKSQP